MRRLVVFQQISLDGYFTDRDGDMSWAKEGNDAEFDAFTSENARDGGVLVFGRVTYELMAGFWTTPFARESLPAVAERMNALPKLVFSRTLAGVSWSNTTLVKDDPVAALRGMKRERGEDLAILGSGSLVAQLAPAGLIDEYQLVVNPVALGGGRTMFEGIPERLPLRLTRSRTFRNGKVLLAYAPA